MFDRRPVRFDHSTLVVTGAGKGLGEAVARRVHALGGNVALLDVDLAAVQKIAEELGERALAVECDVTDIDQLRAAAEQTEKHFGRIDLVLANAGIAPPTRAVADIDPDAFERTVEIDLLGQWRTARAFLPAIERSGGHILFVASIYAFFNGVLNASYAMSKAGVEQLGRALRAELAPRGASAGVAYLGFVDTDLVTTVYAQDHVTTLRKALPAFLTDPIPVGQAADALVAGLARRKARVTAPGWVRPALVTRGLSDPLADRVMMWRARGAVEQARE
ncbi:MAG: short-chain dehydrogenase/reductase [Aeromicrobium sp.]|uniref:short-chain dehydrogenase/reductase n=1 Tax=Aeromicrobium sp. TaxID=1871063 RepID=UPI0039E375F5